MIKNLRRKGFTIVELVIVIAVIAILAAILIPTFSGIIKKANIASDTAMAKNMNTALVMADSEGNKAENMKDVLFTLYEAGYVLENLNPTTNGYYFVWDQESNQILFLTDKFEVHYSSQPYSEIKLNWWMPMDEIKDIIVGQKFSYCMATDISGDLPTFDYLANFDTNGFTLSGDISYNSKDSGSFNVSGIIKGKLTVDTANASVHHYGAIDEVEITEVKSASYHEHGFVRVTLNLVKGRLVIENSGSATSVTLPVADNGSAENNGHIGTLNGVDSGVILINTGYLENTNGEGQPDSTSPEGYVLLINNRTELETFRDAVNFGMRCEGITVKLMSNIDISNRYWIPIGLNDKELKTRRNVSVEQPQGDGPANVFMGIFDGNGKTIKGLTNSGYVAPATLFNINDSKLNAYAYGLFSVTYKATIKNLKMTDVNIVATQQSSACVGAIAGAARGYLFIENCSIKGNVEGTDGVGGAVGYIFTLNRSTQNFDYEENATFKFENVHVEANVNCLNTRAGGIIGALLMVNIFDNSDLEIKGVKVKPYDAEMPTAVTLSTKNNKFIMSDCSFTGSVTGVNTSVGGLIGMGNNGNHYWLQDKPVPATAEITIKNNVVKATITSKTKNGVGRFFSVYNSSMPFHEFPQLTNVTGNIFEGQVNANEEDVTPGYAIKHKN